MKTQSKLKNVKTIKVNKKAKTAPKVAIIAHGKHLDLRHFRLIEHKHTGKLIHHRHTSHLALAILLLLVGFLLYMSEGVAGAETAGSVSVGVIVSGPLPTVGAIITSPIEGAKFNNQKTVNISGTCLKSSFVSVLDNKILAGSTVCTDNGEFTLQVPLITGNNTFNALNYDSLNQSGPSTRSVTVYATQAVDDQPGTESAGPVLPTNPSIIPGLILDTSNCDNYKAGNLPTGGEPHMAVVCVPRLFGPKLNQTLGVLVWGGAPPYAITVDWGNNSESALLSLPAQGYRKETFSYAIAGTYKISLKLKDSEDKETIVQTAVQVNGDPKSPIASLTDDILHTSWLKTPVPLYIMVATVTFGFWIGDIFNRKFGVNKSRRKSQKAV